MFSTSKEPAEPQAGIASVRVGALRDERRENVPGLEDAGVVGKQAEHQPHEKPLQVVPGIARLLQGVVQLAHHFRSFDIDRVLLAERAFPDAKDEGEILDVLGKLAEPKSNCGVIFEVVQLEDLEIAHQNVAGKLVLFEPGKVVEGLFLGACQVAAGALLLHQEDALPEQIDEPALVAKLLDRLLETGDAAAGNAEYLEELVVEGLALAALVVGVLPFLREACRPRLDLVPA